MDAKTAEARTHEFDAQDVEYLRHVGKPLLARVTKPRGAGPFPALVDLHGGAWCMADRNSDKVRHEFLASHGCTVVSIDFRMAKEGAYPIALTDINYAVRWTKLNAKELKTRPELVGISGPSSGGDLAMLAFARRQREVRGAVMAGDQSAQPLSPCQAPGRIAQSAGLAAGHHRAASPVLGHRSQHGRGQPDADPRARREGRAAAGDLHRKSVG